MKMETDTGEGGQFRFKVNGRTVMELTEEGIFYKGEQVADEHLSKAFKELVAELEQVKTADDVLFRLKGGDAKVRHLERVVRDLEVQNSRQALELAAKNLEIKSLKSASNPSVTVSSTSGTKAWHQPIDALRNIAYGSTT